MSGINVDQSEINKFSAQAMHWWDTTGPMAALHAINPLRLQWINERAPVAHKKVIDVGCGGGILAESMARLGARVTGLDLSKEALAVAELHQHEAKLSVEYVHESAESFSEKNPARFDIVTCLEMLEHVPDPASIIKSCADLVVDGGDVFFSTLNRNVKSYLQAIVGAEYILKLIPLQTHDFKKFIRPAELDVWARSVNLTLFEMIGIHYNPFTKRFSLGKDVSVNYLVHMKKIS